MSTRFTRLLRRLLPYLGAAAVIALLAYAMRPEPLLVEGEAVTRGPLAVVIENEGRTRVVDRYELAAPIAGQIRRITLNVGDPVTSGQVVAALDAVPAPALDLRSVQTARAQVAAAQAVLAAAQEEIKAVEATAGFARREATRLRQLAEQGMTPRNVMERAEADARSSEAAVASARFRMRTAEHELAAARAALAYAGGGDPGLSGVLELRSPVAGRVLKRHVESTRVVQPATPLIEIGDPARLEIEVDVLSSDAVRIAPGMRVLLERWGATEALEGRVKRIEPAGFTKVSALGVEEQRVWVIVDIVSPHEQWARLGDGYRVNARFVLWESGDVLRVPTSALFRHADGWAVFVVEADRARLREVGIDHRSALHSEVTKGLAAGEVVIVHPDRELADGARVEMRR